MNEILHIHFNYDFLSLEDDVKNFISNDLYYELFQIDENDNLINSNLLDFLLLELDKNFYE
jgi:hypothetical protein